MEPRGIRPLRVALCSVAIGIFFTAQVVFQGMASGRRLDVEHDIVQELMYWLTWAALSPLIVAIARRWPLDTKPARIPVARHLLASGLLVPAQTVLAFSLFFLQERIRGIMPRTIIVSPESIRTFSLHLKPGTVVTVSLAMWLDSRATILVWGVFMGLMFYWVIVGLYTVFHFRRLYAAEQLGAAELGRRGALLQTELTRAQLDALRAQLRPHFLFNTLNAISVLTMESPHRAQQMLIRLGSLLRRSLDEEQDQVPLVQELAYLNEYMDIQRARFGDRLVITERIEPSVTALCVPVFLLQPLVENAIVHGAAIGDNVTRIDVRAERVDGRLRISVQDNGPGIAPDANTHGGIGLRNTRERLAQLYGEDATLTLSNLAPPGETSGATAVVSLPIRSAPCVS